jgi:hypothetical protein
LSFYQLPFEEKRFLVFGFWFLGSAENANFKNQTPKTKDPRPKAVLLQMTPDKCQMTNDQ